MDNGGINIASPPYNADPSGQIPCDAALASALSASNLVYGIGNFLISGQILVPSGRTIYGAGTATRFFQQGVGFQPTYVFTCLNVSTVAIRDIIIDCGGFGAAGVSIDHSANARLANLEIKNTHGAGIVIGNSSNFFLSAINMSNIGRIIPVSEGGTGVSTGGEHGISLFDSTNGSITQVHLEGVIAAGINLGHCERVTVGNCVLIKPGIDIKGWGGIRFSNQTAHCVAIGNVIDGFSRSANIDGCKDVTLNGNTCRWQYSDSIILRAGTLRDEQGNIVQPEHSSTCEGHTIVGNQIINPGEGSSGGVSGIWIYGSDGQANRDHVIVGNHVSNRNGKSNVVVRNWSNTANDSIKIMGNGGNVPEV